MLKSTPQKWIFPTLSGVLYAMLSVIFFSYAANGFHGRGTVVYIGELSLAAGACTIAAGIWNSPAGRSWFLSLSGMGCSALGLILTFWRDGIAFRTVALLIIAMSVSLGLYELQAARSSRQPSLRKWLPLAAGVISFVFALVFLGFVLRLITLAPSPSAQTFLWIGSYFGFSALCMLGLTLPLRWRGIPIFREHISYQH